MKVRGIVRATIVGAVALALVSCHGTEATYSIGGNISGTNGPVVLRLNGANDLAVGGDGDFTFDQKLIKDDPFNVQVANPTGRCIVQNGAGTVAQSNVKDVSISCAAYATTPAGLLQIVIRSANADGSHVNQPVTTTASAVGGIIADPTDQDASGNVAIVGGLVLSGLAQAPTDVAIFQAPKGNPGGNGLAILHLVLAADGATAVLRPDAVLDTNALAALFAGELYFNVSTAAHPNGEIRGAIELQGGVGASAPALDSTQVVPPTGTTAFGAGVLMVDRATRKLVISYIAHTVVGATSAAINTTVGTGGQALAFTNLLDNFDGLGTNLATPAAGSVLPNLSDLDNSFLYFNVSSGTFPNGEIRGNISPLPQ
ncbi:MAG TPA: CHRD domain-containing protein [Burkholderiales bacterium]|nr:CHRD domain-containing protein [Burkholderiales bacterium]